MVPTWGKKQGKKKSGRGRKLAYALIPGPPGPSAPNQMKSMQWFNCSPQSVTYAGGTVLANNVVGASANFYAWASQFQNVWEEYRVLQANFFVHAVLAQSGFAKIYLDESDATPPTASSAGTKFSDGLVAMNALAAIYDNKKGVHYHWRAEDLTDLAYLKTSSVSTNAVPVYLKFYSDANYGQSATSGIAFLVEVQLLIEFRGPGGSP